MTQCDTLITLIKSEKLKVCHENDLIICNFRQFQAKTIQTSDIGLNHSLVPTYLVKIIKRKNCKDLG